MKQRRESDLRPACNVSTSASTGASPHYIDLLRCNLEPNPPLIRRVRRKPLRTSIPSRQIVDMCAPLLLVDLNHRTANLNITRSITVSDAE